MKQKYVSPKKIQSMYFELRLFKTKKSNSKTKPDEFVPKVILRKKEKNQEN